MPIRGVRNPMPKRGGAPTGIFSSKGKQKVDPTNGYDKALSRYALRPGGETDGKPKGDGGGKELRHQKPHRS